MHNIYTNENFIAWYRGVFGFTIPVATTLGVQLAKDKCTLSELDNSNIDNICHAIRQDSNQPVAEVAVTRLILLSFWIKHQDQTCCEIGTIRKLLVQSTLVMLNALKEQKWLKENWAADNKEPDYVSITLDLSLATKANEKIKTILTHVRGAMRVPLVYAIRRQLIPEI